jgi:hypothetical protein
MECLRTPYIVPWHPWRGRCPSTRTHMRPRGRQYFTPCNFITDATVRPSHGRPCGHRPTIRSFVRYRPHDNPDKERVAEIKMQNLYQGTRSPAIYAVEFQQLTYDLEWNDKAVINCFLYGLKDDVKDLLIIMPTVETL